MRTPVQLLAALLLLCLCGTAAAALRVEPMERARPLQVTFYAVNPVVRTGELVRFKVEGNQEFYLYLFSIGSDGKAALLLPSPLQQYNRYRPGIDYVVPERQVEFVADHPGEEEIVMVASTRRLQLARRWRGGSFVLFSAAEAAEEIARLQRQARRTGAQQVVKRLRLTITGEARAQQDDVQGQMALPPPATNREELERAKRSDRGFRINLSGRTSYHLGERVHYRLKSSRNGRLWVVQVDAKDRFSVLYPPGPGYSNRIKGRTKVHVPSKESGLSVTAQRPVGPTLVAFIVTAGPAPAEMGSTPPLDEVFFSPDATLHKVLQAVRRQSSWGIKKIDVTIKP